jgi:predicted metalloprotease with PDZ domain
MIRCGRAGFWIGALAALLLVALPARATVDYAISVAHPERHVFGVTMRIPEVHDRVLLQIPAWNALYQIRDFSSHVMQVVASDETGHFLPIRKLDKQTWEVTGNGTLTVRYPTYWDDPGPFGAQLNSEHAFVNLAMVLFYVVGRRGEDARLTFKGLPENWRVAVELDAPGKDSEDRSYVASSYDALVDAPVELGRFGEFRIEAGGRPIRVVFHGEIGDRSRLAEALGRIVNYQTSLMGGAPFREFLFLLHVGPDFGGGGMEHANSTAIAAEVPGQLPSYAAHEFFHLWNVKRIRPQALEPVDYTREMYTRSLWFAEGVTNTYGAYTLERTGLWSRQQFYDNLAGQINELESRPAHRWQSAEQSSLDAWLEKYPLYNRAEQSISYYNKGQLLGLLLDIVIRDRTDDRASLDDVLRFLNKEYALRERFYHGSEDLRAAAEAVIRRASPAAPADLARFFSHYVSGTDEIAFADFLGRAGWSLRNTAPRLATLGFGIDRSGSRPPSVDQLEPGSGAEQAGLLEGDLLLELNGEEVPGSSELWLRDHQPGERVTVEVRRDGEVKTIPFVLGQSEPNYQVVETPAPTEKQRRIREGILRGTTDAPR